MANRAYLFFSESEKPTQMPADDAHYCDSRWNIPIAWWFFFSPASLVRMKMEFKGSVWVEPRLVETWEKAKTNFLSRIGLLEKIIENRLPETKLSQFIGTLEPHSKQHLIMDPNEVMEEGETDFARSAKILDALDDETLSFEERFAVIDAYTGLMSLKESIKTERYVFGSAHE